MQPIKNPIVAEVFANYPIEIREKLLELRDLILTVARKTKGVGELEETLRWQQPSYITSSKSGSLIRIDRIKDSSLTYAMYFHCQTNLVESFRGLYPDEFSFKGNRSLIFSTKKPIPTKQLEHCFQLALTYHQKN